MWVKHVWQCHSQRSCCSRLNIWCRISGKPCFILWNRPCFELFVVTQDDSPGVQTLMMLGSAFLDPDVVQGHLHVAAGFGGGTRELRGLGKCVASLRWACSHPDRRHQDTWGKTAGVGGSSKIGACRWPGSFGIRSVRNLDPGYWKPLKKCC